METLYPIILSNPRPDEYREEEAVSGAERR